MAHMDNKEKIKELDRLLISCPECGFDTFVDDGDDVCCGRCWSYAPETEE